MLRVLWFSLFALGASVASGSELVPRKVELANAERPWVTDLTVADVDGDGHVDVVYCEGQANFVGILRGEGTGLFSRLDKVEGVEGPAHVEAVDIDKDGDLDLLIACMGWIFPNNDKIGSVLVLENLGDGEFAKRVLLEGVSRVTDVQAGDVDGDGRLDLAIAQFGYHEGEARLMRNLGNWNFSSEILTKQAGAIHSPIADIDGDGDLDVVTLVSQHWEEVQVYVNEGGAMRQNIIFASPNEDYGSSGIAIHDLDQDGDLDILYANGDGFDYAIPGSRPWHGVQWLENLGAGSFGYRRIGDFAGAYSPVALDVDGDGDLDVVASSCFNDWTQPDSYSLALFENDGAQNFSAKPLAATPTHIVDVEVCDLDGDGSYELVTGGFHAYPPWDHVSAITVWKWENTGEASK
ncbi:FG-GAP repeat domain-containing protein [Pelagicoccus enzymogenes]|uniref:FG-GAP repeat domain-containing protein n=1 Tax=Pelagicoccus enzymogenes TaxID=2773457 RepID=UPI002810F7D0|nr:VCBS repeat-containing protein [Pelagicoccus enzymogenes]